MKIVRQILSILKGNIRIKRFNRLKMIAVAVLVSGALISFLHMSVGCSRAERRVMEATAYCGCGKCNGYTRGNWWCLKLDFWNRYINYGPRKGEKYTGKTASGTKLRPPHPGFFSLDSLTHPWRAPFRLIFFPWLFLPQKGTIAADTNYYPFGTKIYVPGWGWGIVEDRGGAIKGPNRVDLFFSSHGKTIKWGIKKVEVEIYRE